LKSTRQGGDALRLPFSQLLRQVTRSSETNGRREIKMRGGKWQKLASRQERPGLDVRPGVFVLLGLLEFNQHAVCPQRSLQSLASCAQFHGDAIPIR
jgi:hypothetical protein